MREINVRQLLRSFKEEVRDLPVAVTQFGRTICVIQSSDNKIIELPKISEKISKFGDLKKQFSGTQSTTPDNPVVKCTVPLCSEDSVGEGKVYNDVTGNLNVVFLCKRHLDKSLKENA